MMYAAPKSDHSNMLVIETNILHVDRFIHLRINLMIIETGIFLVERFIQLKGSILDTHYDINITCLIWFAFYFFLNLFFF